MISTTEIKLSFIWLELTEKCNLQCAHCYAESSPYKSFEGNMKLEDWLNIIDKSAQAGCKQVQFIGGEPTLHPHFEEILEYTKSKGFQFIEVFTNATRLSDDLTQLFVKNNVNVATSFYSDKASIHDEITLQKGSWKKTVNGIKVLIEKNIPLRVGIISSKLNNARIEQTKVFLKTLGVNPENIGLDKVRNIGRANISTSPPTEEIYAELCGQCGNERICVTSSGDTFPCIMSRRTNLGNIKQGLEQILQSEPLNEFKERLFKQYESNIEINAACYPDLPCSPQKCTPQLPCSPQVGCNPGAGCHPQVSKSDIKDDLSANSC